VEPVLKFQAPAPKQFGPENEKKTLYHVSNYLWETGTEISGSRI